MQAIKYTTRKDKTVRVEVIGEIVDQSKWDDGHESVPQTSLEGISVGERGCLTYSERVMASYGRPLGITDVYLSAIEGVPGNMDRNVLATNGWRGTTDDVAVYADGVRTVQSVEKRKRGVGFVVIFSKPE